MLNDKTFTASDLIPAPPWHFCGENIHLEYQVNEADFLPYLFGPLALDRDAGALVQVAFSNMSCRAQGLPDLSAARPADTNFQECLVKLRCVLDGMFFWFVPFTWVTGDVSLLRGYLQGFPKRMGLVDISRFHSLHPDFPGRKSGERIGGWLSAPDGFMLSGTHMPEERLDRMDGFPLPFLLRRQFPDVATPRVPFVDQLVTPEISYSEDAEVWIGSGSLQCGNIGSPLASLFKPVGPVHSRSFLCASTIVGAKVVAEHYEL